MLDPYIANLRNAAVAQQYGHDSGRCCVCSRPLTNPESMEMGIGPICATRFS